MRIRSLAQLLALALLLCAAHAVAAPPPPLKLVSDVWPPFTDVEGKPHEAVDLVKAALLRGGVQSKTTIVAWTEAEAGLQAGRFDGSAALWRSAAREKYLLFSKPYLENRLLLVARKGERVSLSSPSELAGKRLALSSGYAYGDAITKLGGVTYVYFGNDAECLRAVLANEADYLLLDELMVRHLFEFYGNKASDLITNGQVPLVRYGLHFALRKDYPRAQAIIDEFDGNVRQMMQDGTYNVLLHVPWIQTDVDGDGVPDYVASRRNAPKSHTDPLAALASYPIFYPANGPPDMKASAKYLVDGKSYNTWGDAATTLERGGDTKGKGAYKYSTGVVLLQF
jgi:polar amino acid transport system substrate-binding protein